MLNERRRFWTLLIFIGIFAPFLVTFCISLLTPAPGLRQVDMIGSAPAVAATAPPSPEGAARPAPSSTTGNRLANASLFAGSDGRDVWIVQPIQLDKTGKSPIAAYQVLRRSANTGTWTLVNYDGYPAWHDYPRGLAVTPTLGQTAGIPHVFNADGSVNLFTATGLATGGALPEGQLLHASAAAPKGLFVLTFGQAVPATQPGAPVPATEPAATTTAPSTTPSTTRAAANVFNAFWYRESQWTYLPPLGSPSGDGVAVPTPSSHLALAVSGNYLLALWVDPLRPGDLVVRGLDFTQPSPAWSGPIVSKLPEQTPTVSRLLSAKLDGSLYIFWAVPTGDSVELRGGLLETRPQLPEGITRFALAPRGLLPALSLGTAGRGVSPAEDVALAAAENSIVAVVLTREGTLASATFGERGTVLAGPAPVELYTRRPDFRVGQNITMLVMAAIFVLSLWQWRQKSNAPVLPSGTVLAPLHLRAFAFAVDTAIPYLCVVLFFGSVEAPLSLGMQWLRDWSTPEALCTSWEFPMFLGAYLFHVIAGELLFRRSAGKALFGLQVLMVDGKAPTLAAVLLRNVIRIPELITMILVLYVLISEHRQRLGDLLARTLVVAQEPPAVPEDPDQGS